MSYLPTDEELEIESHNVKLIWHPEFIPFYPELIGRFNAETSIPLFGFIKFFLSTGNNRRFYFSNEQLALFLNVNERTIQRALKELKEADLLVVKLMQKTGGGILRFIELHENYKENMKHKGKPLIEELPHDTSVALEDDTCVMSNTTPVSLSEHDTSVASNTTPVSLSYIKEKQLKENQINNNHSSAREEINFVACNDDGSEISRKKINKSGAVIKPGDCKKAVLKFYEDTGQIQPIGEHACYFQQDLAQMNAVLQNEVDVQRLVEGALDYFSWKKVSVCRVSTAMKQARRLSLEKDSAKLGNRKAENASKPWIRDYSNVNYDDPDVEKRTIKFEDD